MMKHFHCVFTLLLHFMKIMFNCGLSILQVLKCVRILCRLDYNGARWSSGLSSRLTLGGWRGDGLGVMSFLTGVCGDLPSPG